MVKISILADFNYFPIDSVDSADWFYKDDWFDEEKYGKLEDVLRNEGLVKNDMVVIPKGEYEITELSLHDWTFKFGNFEITVVPGLEEEVPFALLYKK